MGGCVCREGTGPDRAGLREDWLPRRALVLGLARSGRAAALALVSRGVEVVAADRSRDADPGRLGDAGVEVRLGTEEESLLQGVELVIKSPGVPGTRRSSRPPARAAFRSGARSSSATAFSTPTR